MAGAKSVKQKVDLTNKDNPCKIQKCLQNINVKSISNGKKVKKYKKVTKKDKPTKNNLNTNHNKNLPSNDNPRDILHEFELLKDGTSHCDDPEKILLNLSNCLVDIDRVTTSMDNQYIDCLKSAHSGTDVIKCMKSVEANTKKLINELQSNKNCQNMSCTTKGETSYGDCISNGKVDPNKFKDYLKSMNDKTSNLNISYINCLDNNKKEEDVMKCISNISQEMTNFKSYLSDFCNKVSRSNPDDLDKQSSLLLINICKKYKKELLEILETCGYDIVQLDSDHPIDNSSQCKNTLNSLVGKFNKCLKTDEQIYNSLLSGQINSLSNNIEDELQTDTSSVRGMSIKKNNKNTIKKNGKNRKNGKKGGKVKNGKTSKKSNCKPWQLCWIKESGYDPSQDVHNIYYGYGEKCSSALGPKEGCNPHKPVYHLPPPIGF